MDDTTGYAIGQFSALTRLSVRMLRYYDEHCVLVPDSVDPLTGYRRYAARQVADATRIRQLRDVGFGVSSIAALLAIRDPAEYVHALRLQRDVLVAESRAAQQRVASIDTLLTHQEITMADITISERTEPAFTLVALRGVVPTYADEGKLWERFMPELARQRVQAIGAGGVIEFDDEYKEHDVDEAVWVPVAPGTDVAGPLQVLEFPERRVAVATLHGSYDGIGEANAQLGSYLAEHDLRLSDHGYNRYLTNPANVPPEENVTEICYPVAQARAA